MSKDDNKKKKDVEATVEELRAIGQIPEKAEIVIRYDDPKKVYEPTPVNVTGSIFAPLEFIKKRTADYEANEVHVLYNKEQGKITLTCNEKSRFKDVITGTIQENPELAKFHINKDKRFQLKELIKLIRFNKWLFVDITTHGAIVKALQTSSAQVQQSVNKSNDQRGNIEESFVQKITTNHELIFTASAAPYLGTEIAKFKVEIVAEARDRAVEFWMESVELEEIMISQRNTLVDEQVAELKKSYVCIEQ